MRTEELILRVFIDEDGAEFFLPTDEEMVSFRKSTEEEIEEIQFRGEIQRNGMSEERKNISRIDEKVRILRMRKEQDRIEAKRKLLLKQSKPKSYYLRIPTYGEYQEAQRAAERLDEEEYEVEMEPFVMMDRLLSTHVEGMSQAQARELDPGLADKLWRKLTSEMFVREKKLEYLIGVISDFMSNKLSDHSRLIYEARIWLNWHNTQDLPERSMYEMDVDVVLYLFAISSEIEKINPKPDPVEEQEDPYMPAMSPTMAPRP